MMSGLCAAILSSGLAGGLPSPSQATPPPASPSKPAPLAVQGAPDTGSGDGVSAPPASETAVDQTLPTTADDDQKPPAEKPGFSASITLDNSVPSGTFILNNAYTFNPAWTTNFYVRPSYTFEAWGQSLRAELWENFYIADILDKNTVDTRRFDFSDLRISLYDAKIYSEPHTKIGLGGYLRGSIPLSYASQFASRITSLSAGVSLTKNVYRFGFQLGLSASKNFNTYTAVRYPCSASAVGPVAVVPGQVPDVSSTEVLNGFSNGICRTGDASSVVQFTNVDWALVPNGSISYNFTDKLQLSIALYYFDEFKYPIGGSASANSQIKDSNGNLVVSDIGRADGIWGITNLSYTLNSNYSLSLGLWNAALPAGVPPKTADNRTFRFPFLDTYSLNNNDWNLYFDINATF